MLLSRSLGLSCDFPARLQKQTAMSKVTQRGQISESPGGATHTKTSVFIRLFICFKSICIIYSFNTIIYATYEVKYAHLNAEIHTCIAFVFNVFSYMTINHY